MALAEELPVYRQLDVLARVALMLEKKTHARHVA